MHGARRDHLRGRSIGMIFQTFNLLHGFSALENVMAALMFSEIPRGEHDRRAGELLRHLAIEDVHKQVDKFSVGQQQRIAVARAVACRPVLVLADEPTASLDPENAATAIELIQPACRSNGSTPTVSSSLSATGRRGAGRSRSAIGATGTAGAMGAAWAAANSATSLEAGVLGAGVAMASASGARVEPPRAAASTGTNQGSSASAASREPTR